jgi:uncharacterized protein YbaP (TraB family)
MKFKKPIIEIRRIVPLFITIAFILALFPQAAFSQEQSATSKKSFLWEVASSTTTVYALGSIHLMKQEMYPLNPTIENAFDKSAFLVVEVNSLNVDPAKMQQIMLKGMYQGDKTLKDDLSDETFSMLKTHLEKMNIPMANLVKFKPGMIVMTLANIQLMKLGFSPEYGIDMYFLKKAQGKIPILELETMDEQMELLLGDSLNDDLILKNSILEWEQTKETMDTVISLWNDGNADQMANLIIKEPLQENPELLPVYQKFFFDRNKKMTNKIKGFLATEQIYFVVVGSGHLIGENGIISLLKKAGYTVNQL